MHTIKVDDIEIDLYEEEDFRKVNEEQYDRLIYVYHELEKLGYFEGTIEDINNLFEEYALDGINIGGTFDRITDGKRFVAFLNF